MKKPMPFFSSFSLFMVFTLSSLVGDQQQETPYQTDLKTTVFASDWSEVDWSNNYSTYGQEVKAAPQLNTENLKNALVLRFIRWEATGTYFSLPLALNEESMITMMLQPGEIEMYYYSERPVDAPAIQARYIIISPEEHLLARFSNTKQVITRQFQAAGVDIRRYEDVAAFLGI